MDKLTLYISKAILSTILIVMTLFVGLELVFALVNELRYVGTADYHLSQAAVFILLSLPQLIVQIFPMSALVGTLLGLGQLASHHELVVMRASGLSLADISLAILKLSIVLAAVMWLVGEWVSPVTERVAHAQKSMALSGGQALRTLHGTWMRDGNSFIHIQTIHTHGYLEGITRYDFDEQMQLQKASFARLAKYEDDHWILHEIKETLFSNHAVRQQTVAIEYWKSSLDPQVLSMVGVKDLAELSIKGLWQTMQHRASNGLDARPFALAFWQKLVRPLATLVMMFLAIPFVFGPLRSSTMGLRLLVGALVGFAFYLFNQLFAPLTLVYHLPVIVGAWLPTVIFLLIGLISLRKVH